MSQPLRLSLERFAIYVALSIVTGFGVALIMSSPSAAGVLL